MRIFEKIGFVLCYAGILLVFFFVNTFKKVKRFIKKIARQIKTPRFKLFISLWSVILVNCLHIIYFDNNDKYDVYLFYDHSRYLTNILLDIGVLYAAIVFSYHLSRYRRVVFLPVFYLCIGSAIMYFLTYRQLASLMIIPPYLLCTVILLIKTKK